MPKDQQCQMCRKLFYVGQLSHMFLSHENQTEISVCARCHRKLEEASHRAMTTEMKKVSRHIFSHVSNTRTCDVCGKNLPQPDYSRFIYDFDTEQGRGFRFCRDCYEKLDRASSNSMMEAYMQELPK